MSLGDTLLKLGDGLSWVQSLGAGVCAVHNGVATIQFESIV
jgi:hypothetical protein